MEPLRKDPNVKQTPSWSTQPVSYRNVTLNAGYLGNRYFSNRDTTLAYEYDQCQTTGRFDNLKLRWEPGDEPVPHKFWDSDVAKWLEAASYVLGSEDDPELDAKVDRVVALLAGAQQDDGYLNSYFTQVAPDRRWTNLRDDHELYCAGHLMEAAVAHFEATGKRTMLDIMTRYADYIRRVFGPGEHQRNGYPGHEEIELALVRLGRAAGRSEYVDLAAFFVNERGRQPHYFDLEARARGETAEIKWPSFRPGSGRYDYLQAHLPVREQDAAEGHSVRAGYLYAGMADVAAETGDAELFDACRRLWRSIVDRRMYVTGGIGSHRFGERFSVDYDLPNEEAYAETCAAIALVFFAQRMLQMEPHREYADVMERSLFNGVLSGVSLDGESFFYANPLAINPTSTLMPQARADLRRQPWYGCACCPPNIARLLASIGGYIYSVEDPGTPHPSIFVHLYTASRAEVTMAGRTVILKQNTDYPWDGTVRVSVTPDGAQEFSLQLRAPGWCESWSLSVNGESFSAEPSENGYVAVRRKWNPGDTVTLTMEMPVVRVSAHPAVRHNAGRIALRRGPLVYCFEETDNGTELADLALPRDSVLTAEYDPELLGGIVAVTGTGVKRDAADWGRHLYRSGPGQTVRTPVRAVPYALWNNREPGEMVVWVRDV